MRVRWGVWATGGRSGVVPPMGTRFPPPAPSLDGGLWLADKTIDIDKHPRQTSVVFRMPNKNPALAKQRQHEWYVRNKDEILKRKRERRAAQKKQPAPRPKLPAPTPKQIARTRELNWQACNCYNYSFIWHDMPILVKKVPKCFNLSTIYKYLIKSIYSVNFQECMLLFLSQFF